MYAVKVKFKKIGGFAFGVFGVFRWFCMFLAVIGYKGLLPFSNALVLPRFATTEGL
jgi:hypothetical protein